jgi:acyl-CoA dehydrogenase
MGHTTIPQREDRSAALIELVHQLGKEHIAPYADRVDQEARFPAEAFKALKEAKLLSSYVPEAHGGMGLSLIELTKICETLALYCGSTAMIFAMHQIQVACIVHHALGSAFFRGYIEDLVQHQYLLASATTEVGIGGDVRSSLCAVEVSGDRFTLEKKAPVISYGEAADAILVTCRKSADAGRNDQSHVLVRKEDCTLTPLSDWNTLGFRGTCSSGFSLVSQGRAEQILPVPYADIHAKTMHPFAHSVWSSLWLGIATDAMNKARAFVRAEARKTPGQMPPSALRLAELDTVLFTMRGSVHQTVREYHELLEAGDDSAFVSNFGFSSRINNLKLASSELIVEIVGKAMLICGISGYRNDSKFSLGRQLRDAYGAALMVNNDRILGQSAPMQLVQREG